MSAGGRPQAGRHILMELGFSARRAGDELRGTASVTPPMHVPGTVQLRTSILATWADTLGGLLAAHAIGPRVPVTLELDVHLFGPAPGSGVVRSTGRVIKAGRTVFVAGVDFTTESGEPVATAAMSFMSAPDPAARLPATLSVDLPPSAGRLTIPVPGSGATPCARSGCSTCRRSGPAR
jgi:acyl-coenzyme A thioesterase PaaI-like protein